MNQPKRYYRSNAPITISIFYEQYQNGKYNFSPAYQRESGIWKEMDKQFLIDTVFKNFPMPSIFCEQIIKNGKTTYDVIDGKQRLSSIIAFINDEITLPKNFSEDGYGYSLLNGKKMSEIVEIANGNNILPPDEVAKSFLDMFWSYKIIVEYIENPDEKIVRGIFDRLNRNGERLNSQELRKAKYFDSEIFKVITLAAESQICCDIIAKNIRQKNINFWIEVFVFIYNGKIMPGNARSIDLQIDEMSQLSLSQINVLEKAFNKVIEIYNSFEVDVARYKLSKEVHLYNLLYIAFSIFNKKLEVDNIKIKLNSFFEELRLNGALSKNKNIVDYYNTTQSGSKSLTQRENRYSAIKEYLLSC